MKTLLIIETQKKNKNKQISNKNNIYDNIIRIKIDYKQ